MSHRLQRQALTAGFFVLLVFAWPHRAAHAQAVDVTNRSATLSTASVSMTSTVVGGVIISVMVDTGSAGLEAYLKQNAVAVMGDLSTGAGDTLEDLADVFDVAPRDRRAFARHLFTRRERLVRLLRDVDAATAQQFVAVVLSP